MAGPGKRGRKKLPRGNCLTCGVSLEDKLPGAKYCSQACSGAATRARRKRAICKRCGVEFEVHRSDCSTFCSRECSFAYKKEHAKPKPEAVEADPRRCVICGRELTGRLLTTCSVDCRKALASRRANALDEAQWKPVPYVCKECGGTFTPEYKNKHRNYCSDACMHKNCRRVGKQVRRARKKAVPSEAIWTRRVYERDGWRCGICGKKVNPAFKSPHPMSVTLDHIIPIALGGSHTMGNVQCAHRSCNSRKGASGAGQLKIMECFT